MNSKEALVTNADAAAQTKAKEAVKKSRGNEKLRAFHEEEAMGRVYDARLVRRLWPFVKPHARYLYLSLGMLIVMTAGRLIEPLVMGAVVEQTDSRSLLRYGVALAALLLVVQTLNFAQVYAMQFAGARAMFDLRAHIFQFFQTLRLRFFDRTPVGRLVTRATNDVDAVGELFSSGVLNAMGDLILLVSIVAIMLVKDWRLTVVSFATLPLVLVVVNYVRRRSREAYRDIRSKTARLNAFLNEQVSGVAIVQAYARERSTAEEFREINEAYRDANKRSIYYEAILDAAIEMISTLCIASVLFWVGPQRVVGHPVTFADLVIFTGYVRRFFEPVSLISQRYIILQSGMSGAERIFQLLDTDDVDAAPLEEGQCEVSGGKEDAISFTDVSFEYKPGVPVLKDVTLHAKQGEKVALVGATGAGKTTVASLLLRLYEPNSGCIRILGRDSRGYDRQKLRELFSVVPQDVFLFAGSVLSNIAMSDPTPDRAKAEMALDQIGAREIFERRQGYLDATVDERGTNFSAGERQLLAFARAVYRKAPLLILDEATASVDSDTERRLQVALDAVMRERTAIIIAHRLSTIRAADRIIVFHKGKIVESGTHNELLAVRGVYSRLYRMQFAHEHAGQSDVQTARESASP